MLCLHKCLTYSRYLSLPQEYQKFKIGNDGALEGVGLLIASDRDTGRLVYLISMSSVLLKIQSPTF